MEDVPSEREYHRALAVSLMKSVGLDDAIDDAQDELSDAIEEAQDEANALIERAPELAKTVEQYTQIEELES